MNTKNNENNKNRFLWTSMKLSLYHYGVLLHLVIIIIIILMRLITLHMSTCERRIVGI